MSRETHSEEGPMCNPLPNEQAYRQREESDKQSGGNEVHMLAPVPLVVLVETLF
jgi:hypothetical protein